MYKVLWIDDQHQDDEMIQFLIDAENNGLILEGYASFEEGFEILERNIEQFDVILLDGLFYEKKDQAKGTENVYGLGESINKINELKRKKVFPWFVLSGKDKFTKGDNDLLKANKVRCYDKTNPSDVEELLKTMRNAAKEQTEAELKYKYSDLLEVASDSFLGSDKFSRLFSLIKQVENKETINRTEDMLTPLRKFIENIFDKLSEIGIIPKAVIADIKKSKMSSLFLANKHSEYEHHEEFIPLLISENIHRLLNITNDGSHDYNDSQFKVDSYMKNKGDDNLYRSSVYLLFDILLWFKEFYKNNQDLELNKLKWRTKTISIESDSADNWISGTLIRIAENGFGTFKPDSGNYELSILPKDVNRYELKLDDKIEVTTKPSPDGEKTFIDKIRKD